MMSGRSAAPSPVCWRLHRPRPVSHAPSREALPARHCVGNPRGCARIPHPYAIERARAVSPAGCDCRSPLELRRTATLKPEHVFFFREGAEPGADRPAGPHEAPWIRSVAMRCRSTAPPPTASRSLRSCAPGVLYAAIITEATLVRLFGLVDAGFLVRLGHRHPGRSGYQPFWAAGCASGRLWDDGLPGGYARGALRDGGVARASAVAVLWMRRMQPGRGADPRALSTSWRSCSTYSGTHARQDSVSLFRALRESLGHRPRSLQRSSLSRGSSSFRRSFHDAIELRPSR